MKLIRLKIFQCRTPFDVSFPSSHRTRAASDSILIEFLFDQGLSGWGESAPRPYVTGETSESVCRLIKEVFAPILFDADIDTLEEVADLLEILEGACRRKRIVSFQSALGSCDLALLDALGKKEGRASATLLGPPVRSDIPRSLSIPLLPPAVLAGYAGLLRKLEIMDFKVLMHADPIGNRDRVQWVRAQVNPAARIRVEANGRWTLAEALANIRLLEDMGIVGIEQPVVPGDIAGLRIIREETGLPVIVDESMCNLEDAQRLIEAKACDILNIKVSKCGGLLRSRRIADLACAHGLSWHLGTHVGETPVLSSAGDCLAMTGSGVLLYENGSPLLFGGRMETGTLIASNPDRLGLGVEVDQGELVQIDALCPTRRRAGRDGCRRRFTVSSPQQEKQPTNDALAADVLTVNRKL